MLLLSLLVACGGSHGGKDNGGDNGEDTTPPAPTPLQVTGYGTDSIIADGVGDSQGEPSAIALDDNTLLASWMESSGYTIYVKMVRSTDGGATWTAPAFVDEDRWGYQNDPAFAYAGGRVYYTWLAIESRDASSGSIYCIDSTDGGVTWSDKVKLSTDADSVDRQWMASDPTTGKVVVTWDSFSGRNEWMSYSETTEGCSAMSAPEQVTTGVFLNGIPAIDTDGTVWASRNEFTNHDIQHILSERTADGWVDHPLQSYDYPSGSPYGDSADGGTDSGFDTGLPGDTGEVESGPMAEGERGPWAAPTLIHQRITEDLFVAATTGFAPPRANAAGTYDGEYSPVLMRNPNGGLDIVTLATEKDDPDYADVYYFHWQNNKIITKTVLNQDKGSEPQAEPWIAVDRAGGIHTIWYDGREGQWRLYGATSDDGGNTWNEYPVGDNLFTNGFDEMSYYNAWVGHFQGLVTTDTNVVAIFGSAHARNHSFIYCDRSVGP